MIAILRGATQAIRCLAGRHAPAPTGERWVNSASGDGFDVVECQHCGRELTRRLGGRWRAIAADERA